MELLQFITENIYDAVGLLGVCFYIASYSALQFGKLDGNSVAYCVLNGSAASLVLVSLLFSDFNLASAIIQIVWITVSLCGLYRYWKLNQARTKRRQLNHHPARYRAFQ